MAYQKIYRGLFSNTLDDANNAPVDQVVRIDINDTASGSAEESFVTAGYQNTFNTVLIQSDGHEIYEELAAFFFSGQRLRIEDSAGIDGEYIITAVVLTPPTDITTGKVQFNMNSASPPTSTFGTDVIFTNIPTDPIIIPLRMGGDPLHISVIDNDEDKFTTIRSKQAEIKIKTGGGIDINTFCEGEDQRYYVEIFIDDLIIFRGFLMIPDMQQDFMPDPNDLLLVATDNLPLLKDVALVDADGEVPQFDNKLIEYLQWSLRRTGIIQNINIINSLKHGTKTLVSDAIFVSADNKIFLPANDFFYTGQQFSVTGSTSNDGTYTVKGIGFLLVQIVLVNQTTVVDETVSGILFTDLSSIIPFFEVVNIDAKTFEASIGTCENCYSVIQKILGEDSVLFQYQGEWWIVRIDEIEEILGTFQYSVDHYDSDGTFISNEVIVKSKNIGAPDVMHFMNDDAIVIPDRAFNHVKETYKFDNPQELVCNIALERGELIGDLPDETIKGAVYNVKNYTPECWTLKKNISSDLSSDTDGWIKNYLQNGYIKNRSISIEESPSDSFYKWVSDIRLPMNQGDKFTIGCDFVYKTNLSLGGPGSHVTIAMFYIRLYGDDGTFWTLYATDGPDAGFFAGTSTLPKWVLSNAAWTTDPQLCYYETQSDDGDFTTPTRCSIDSAPLPVSGKLEIGLVASIQTSTSAKEFQSISFDYIPFINGSYQRYTGQYHQISQIGNNKAIREKQVYMSDSPSLLLKGAMKFFNGTDYVLCNGFTDAHNEISVPFGQIQAFAVWNQYRLSARNFDGEVKRLENETIDGDGKYDGVDLIDKIELTDANPATVNRYFLILHYDIDYYLLEMKCYIASLYRTDVGKIYTDKHDFIYTTE